MKRHETVTGKANGEGRDMRALQGEACPGDPIVQCLDLTLQRPEKRGEYGKMEGAPGMWRSGIQANRRGRARRLGTELERKWQAGV